MGCVQLWWRLSLQHPRTLQALRALRHTRRAYHKFLEATPHFGIFVQQMREDQGRVTATLSKRETRVAAGGGGGERVASPPGGSGRGGGGGAAAVAAAAAGTLEELSAQVRQLQATNDQLAALVAQVQAGGGGRGGAALLAAQGPIQRTGSAGGGAASGEAVLIASAAVEQRVRRLEDQIANLDKGMARCLGQVWSFAQRLAASTGPGVSFRISRAVVDRAVRVVSSFVGDRACQS